MSSLINTNSNLSSSFLEISKSLNKLNKSEEKISNKVVQTNTNNNEKFELYNTREDSEISNFHDVMRDATDSLSLVETIDTALKDIGSALEKLKVLGKEYFDASYTQGDTYSINEQYKEIKLKIDDISQNAEYSGYSPLEVNGEISVQFFSDTLKDAKINFRKIDTQTLGLGNSELSSTQTARESLEKIDHASNTISKYQEQNNDAKNQISLSIDDSFNRYKEKIFTSDTQFKAKYYLEDSSTTKEQIVNLSGNLAQAQANTSSISVSTLLR